MSGQPPQELQPLPPLACSEILYRAITTHYWIKKHKVRGAAFRLRDLPTDENGLSVNIASNYSVERVIEFPQYTCFAVATLHTGRVRDIGLNILPDPPPPPYHGNIVGLPRPADLQQESDKQREDLSELLAEQARLICYTRALKEFAAKWK